MLWMLLMRGRRLCLARWWEVLLFGWWRILLFLRRRRILWLWVGVTARWRGIVLLLVCGRGCGRWWVGLASWRRGKVLLLGLLVWYALGCCSGVQVLWHEELSEQTIDVW